MKKKSARPVASKNLLQILFISLFLIIYFSLSYYLQLFVIQNVECAATNEECSEPVQAELNHLKGRIFFSSAISQTTTKILNSDPYISSIEVKRSFPHTVSFHLEKKDQIAQISCEQTNLLINTDGKVEENTKELQFNIPNIPTNQPLCESLLSQGYIDLNQLHALMSFSQIVSQQDSKQTMLWSDESTVLVQIPEAKLVILPLTQVEQSYQMYRYLSDQDQLIDGWKELDLRFQKAIVKTQ